MATQSAPKDRESLRGILLFGSPPHNKGTAFTEAERAELSGRFADEAACAEEEALSSGKALELAATFDYLAARASGAKAPRPKARAWRPSK